MEWTNEKDTNDLIRQAKEEEKDRVIKEAFQIVDFHINDLRKIQDRLDDKNKKEFAIKYDMDYVIDQLYYDLGNVK